MDSIFSTSSLIINFQEIVQPPIIPTPQISQYSKRTTSKIAKTFPHPLSYLTIPLLFNFIMSNPYPETWVVMHACVHVCAKSIAHANITVNCAFP